MSDDTPRTIAVDYIARVEGEGALSLVYRDGEIADIELRIFEPPRFFEALLVGRSALEAPDITSRICGICPVAYQMSACQAMEQALGVQLPPALHELRRLLYCGEWIESHVLHMAMLHAPDFLGVDDAMELARTHRDIVVASLKVKKAGNAVVRVLGGREIHPINARVGGFWGLPRRTELDALHDQLVDCRADAEALVRWAATLDIPALERDYRFVALAPEGRYPFLEGPIALGELGPRIQPIDWHDHVTEHHVERSNALHATLNGQGAYLTGPLARFALNAHKLPPHLRVLASDLGLSAPVCNPFASILVRGIETLAALDEAIGILQGLGRLPEPSVPVTLRAGVGAGASEAPRGILVHRYELDDDGLITRADIIPPTAQNQLSIEGDLRALAPEIALLDDAAAARRAEFAIRNHDPCISCATHFLTFSREGL